MKPPCFRRRYGGRSVHACMHAWHEAPRAGFKIRCMLSLVPSHQSGGDNVYILVPYVSINLAAGKLAFFYLMRRHDCNSVLHI